MPKLNPQEEKLFDEKFDGLSEEIQSPKWLEERGEKYIWVNRTSDIKQFLAESNERAVMRVLEKWLEDHPQESLERAVESSLKHGGVNSYGLGYDQGYLDCHNQIVKALTTSKEE